MSATVDETAASGFFFKSLMSVTELWPKHSFPLPAVKKSQGTSGDPGVERNY
jgi:hypothetical protein